MALGMVFLLIIFVAFLNLKRCTNYVEFDEAKLYRHCIEMFRNKSILIEGWDYISTMELDCTLLFALPIYAVIKDIYLAFGIANLIFLGIYLVVIWDILNKITAKRIYKYFAVVMFLLPYRIGMLEYLNMMFFNGGQYVVKVLIPLIAIDLFTEEPSELFKIKNIIFLCLFGFLFVITSMSSGTYVLLSGIIPLIFCAFYNVIISGTWKNMNRRRIFLIVYSFVCFLIGYFLCRVLNVAPNSEGTDFTAVVDFVDNIKLTFWGYLSIFFDSAAVSVLSLNGLKYLVRIGFTVIFTILIIINVRKTFDFKHAKSTLAEDMLRFLTFPFVVTAIILNLTRCCFSDVYYPERYFFIGIVPLFLSFPYFMSNIEKLENKLLSKCLEFVVFMVIALMIPVCIQDTIAGIRTGYEGGYAHVKTLCDYVKRTDVNTVYFLHNLPDCEVARLFDADRKYTIIKLNDDGVPTLDSRDFYSAATDRGYYDDTNFLVVREGSGYFEMLPEYLRSSYVEETRVAGYVIYKSMENKFDNMSGFPATGADYAVDYAYTPGYTYFGNINLYGYLETQSTDNFVLLSPEIMKYPGNETISLYFETMSGSGSLCLRDKDMNIIDETVIEENTEKVTLNSDYVGMCYVTVFLNDGANAVIKNLVYAP